MSVPPNGPPPGNYYGAPPPSNSGGCLKAAGITCAVLVVLGAVLIFFGVRAAKNAMEQGTGVFGIVGKAVRAQQQGHRLQAAVVKYHQQHGKYPPSLMTLVSDGSIDGKDLHSELDADPSPGHVSWHYTRPAEGAPGSTPLLTMHFRIAMPNGTGAQQQTPEGNMVINLDGTSPSKNTYQTPSPPITP